MARPETLVAGNCYFLLGFQDTDLHLPLISTLVYVRSEVDPDDGRYWLFQELSDTSESSSTEPEDAVGALVGFTDEDLYQILDFEALQRRLAEIAADHPLHTIPSADAAALAPNTDFSGLAIKVAEFIATPDCVSLTITILFTDDGFSLGRPVASRESADYQVTFFPHPRRDPTEESKIRSLFLSLGIEPQVDYLADEGRTRVLAFRIPGEQSGIVSLCARLLTEIYDMRVRDQLQYRFLRRSDI